MLKFFPLSNIKKRAQRKKKSGILFLSLNFIISSICFDQRWNYSWLPYATLWVSLTRRPVCRSLLSPYFKKKHQQHVWACLETRPTYLAGETMRRSPFDIFWPASEKKLHVKATINYSYQHYQHFDALVIKLLNSAYVHVKEKTKKQISI